MFLFFLSINLPPGDFSLNKLEKLSTKSHILINFNPNRFNVSKEWETFTSTTRENNSITCILIHCLIYNDLCQRFSITEPQTYLTIYHKFYQIHKLTDNSIQGLNKLYQKSFNDPSSYCQNYLLPEDEIIKFDYPTYVLRYNNNQSCLELSKYKALYPNLAFYLQRKDKNYSNPYLKIDLCFSPSICFNSARFYDPLDFIEEFRFNHFGEWTLNEVMHLKRRLVLIVYNDLTDLTSSKVKYRPERSDFERYINSYSNYFLFGQMPFSLFQKNVGQLKEQQDTPFMLITNTKKTRFMIVDLAKMSSNQISEKLNAARQGFLELHMQYFFDAQYAMQNAYNPKNVFEFSVAAFCVIGFTAAMIFWKAYWCINAEYIHKYNNVMSM